MSMQRLMLKATSSALMRGESKSALMILSLFSSRFNALRLLRLSKISTTSSKLPLRFRSSRLSRLLKTPVSSRSIRFFVYFLSENIFKTFAFQSVVSLKFMLSNILEVSQTFQIRNLFILC